MWRYVHRAIDQYGQVIDGYVSAKRDSAAARAFSLPAITTAGSAPAEVVTDRAPVHPKLLDELLPQLEQDGIVTGVFYTPGARDVMPSAGLLRRDLLDARASSAAPGQPDP